MNACRYIYTPSRVLPARDLVLARRLAGGAASRGNTCDTDIATGRWERQINCDTKDQIDIGRIGAVESVKYVVVVRKPWLHCSTTNLL
jgi:hypothetical protein